jgi:hypothetical protein
MTLTGCSAFLVDPARDRRGITRVRINAADSMDTMFATPDMITEDEEGIVFGTSVPTIV